MTIQNPYNSRPVGDSLPAKAPTATIEKKILVVDNDPVIQGLLKNFLTKQGHIVSCAGDVFGCLDTLVEHTPDIIFIDLIMPRIGGDDLCRILRNMDNLRHCFLVIVSGVALEQSLDLEELGADAIIAKRPFREMSAHILRVLREAEIPRRKLIVPRLQGADNLHFRQISDELLQNNQHLKVILESMSQGIVELIDDRIAYCNPMASKFLNLPREQLLGRRQEDILPPSLIDATITLRKTARNNCITVQLQHYQVNVEVFSIAGTPPSTIVMLTDITERRQMEAVIEAANLTKNLGYVFSGIRHEIGNPVNSIKMALSVLQKNLATYDLETIATFLDRSLQEVTRLEYLLKALKNYSLFERPVMQSFHIAGFLSDFISLVSQDFSRQKIKIHSILPPENLQVIADSRALHHVMLNLMTNAADAIVETTNPQIIISARATENQVEIKVDDNGKGMSPSEQQNLFKPFFTSKANGTGLGLVIVQKMLLAMNGKISLESYPDMGTTATITLPREGL